MKNNAETKRVNTLESSSTTTNVSLRPRPSTRALEDHCRHIYFSVRRKGRSWKSSILSGIQAKLWSKSAFYGRRCLPRKRKSFKNNRRKTERGTKINVKNSYTKRKKNLVTMLSTMCWTQWRVELWNWLKRKVRENSPMNNLSCLHYHIEKAEGPGSNLTNLRRKDQGSNHMLTCN